MEKRAFRTWALWRRIQYATGFFAIWGLVGMSVYYLGYYQPPSCFDSLPNGDESGVDCGGSCVRICAAEVVSPKVLWAESFEIAAGQYNAVAYIDNENTIAASPEVGYTFQLLNQGIVVAERTGSTVLPPDSDYPVFEGRIFTENNQPVTQTRLILEPVDLWLPATIGRTQFRTRDIALSRSDVRPRLDVEIENTELTAASDIEVVATIFNDRDEPVTASQTFIENIAGRTSQDIVFTWPNPIAKTVRSCIIPTDVALGIDLSGSMNNDSSNPPQPLTDALQAAGLFVDSLQPADQVSVVTFATRGLVVAPLTAGHVEVVSTIEQLRILPTEESGFTNTAAALRLAQEELNSARHNDNARRVLVLLTDGLPTGMGAVDAVAEAQAAAEVLRTDGVEVYAIGLGENVERDFILNIATTESNAFFAPTGADLMDIYTTITSALCETGPTRIDVIAKTKTNFAPLR